MNNYLVKQADSQLEKVNVIKENATKLNSLSFKPLENNENFVKTVYKLEDIEKNIKENSDSSKVFADKSKKSYDSLHTFEILVYVFFFVISALCLLCKILTIKF
jgi:hypothetical protein